MSGENTETATDEIEIGEPIMNHPTFTIHDSILTAKGRITIPERKRERYKLEEDDWVNAVVHTTDGESVQVNDTQIDYHGQITMPKLQRRLYGIERGDVITVEVQTAEDWEREREVKQPLDGELMEEYDFEIHDKNIVTSGRMTIPERKRVRYGLERGDWVNYLVHTKEGDKFRVDDARIDQNAQVTVPKTKQDMYDINVGDIIDAYVHIPDEDSEG